MSIPASQIVSVNPGVLSSGGTSLALNGLFLTQNALMPSASVMSFASAAAVGAFFGLSSTEYSMALIYFNGYDNSTIKPQAMLFAPFQTGVVAAWLRSGSLASVTLAQLKTFSGTLTITMNGNPLTSSTINLASATSFSNAATLIAAGFTGGPTVTWNATLSAFQLTSTTTGAASTMTVATGTLAASLNLTTATGAVLSQGAIADTPATALANAVTVSQNWVTLVTLWEPVTADKQNFASWAAAQNSRYLYIGWDTDAQAITSGTTTAFGYLALQAAYDGTMAITGNAAVAAANGTTLAAVLPLHAAFVAGTIASINFAQRNGRITLMFRSQSGLTPMVTDQTTYNNMIANGYSAYCQFATANQGFTFFANGQLTGKWKWADSFVNQVYLNSQFQLSLLTLLNAMGSIPYNVSGYNMVRAALLDNINAAIDFGTIRTGVTLSSTQAAAVDAAVGSVVHNVIQTQGYYLQISDPGATVRGNRGTPNINFWYTDGEAIQQITMASIDIQ